MDASPVEALAAALIDARRARRLVPAAEAEALAAAVGVEGALCVQQRVADAVGPVGAWKMAPLTAAGPASFAPIFAATIRPSGAGFTPDELFDCAVEIEIGFRIVGTLPDPAAADFEEALRRAVVPIPVLEVLDSRMEGFLARSPVAKLADLNVNGGLVVGIATGAGGDLARPVVRLKVGSDTVLDRSFDAGPSGDALATLAAFVAAVGMHCGGPRPGQIVITGSLGGAYEVPPGTAVEGSIAGLGSVAMTFG